MTHTVTGYNMHANSLLPTPVKRRILFRTLLSIRNHSLSDLLIQGKTVSHLLLYKSTPRDVPAGVACTADKSEMTACSKLFCQLNKPFSDI